MCKQQTAHKPVRLRWSRRKGGGGRGLTQNPEAKTNRREPCACGQQQTDECIGLPTLAQSMHKRSCRNKQWNTRECRPLIDALTQVACQTPLPPRNMYRTMALELNNSHNRYQERKQSTCRWTTNTAERKATDISSQNALAKVHKGTQDNPREGQPITDIPGLVPHQTASTKESWQMHMD